ncbi:MAG: hypothetical protein ABI415_08965, partial [Flavitalea sp.]
QTPGQQLTVVLLLFEFRKLWKRTFRRHQVMGDVKGLTFSGIYGRRDSPGKQFGQLCAMTL